MVSARESGAWPRQASVQTLLKSAPKLMRVAFIGSPKGPLELVGTLRVTLLYLPVEANSRPFLVKSVCVIRAMLDAGRALAVLKQ